MRNKKKGMINTFDLLAKLDLTELQKLENPNTSPELIAFLVQLKSDFNSTTVQGFDAYQAADNLLKKARALAKQKHPSFSEDSLAKLDRINQLFNGRGEYSIYSLELYQAIDTVNMEISDKVKNIISDYKTHLEQKVEKEGLSAYKDREDTTDKELPTKQQKLLNRYQAISKIDEKIKNEPILNHSYQTEVRGALDTCLKNNPSWSERPFLQKLTDIFSIGLKPLYRAFFSKEKTYKEELDQATPKKSGPK